MKEQNEYIQCLVWEYRNKMEPLLKYIPWLTEKQGNKTGSIYDGEGLGENSVPVPVYDGTLMNFIREVQKAELTDRNYVYVYSRYQIRNTADERRLIKQATIKEMDILTGILSKYVLGGMTKASVWPQGVENGIFLRVLLKMKEIVEFWDRPLV